MVDLQVRGLIKVPKNLLTLSDLKNYEYQTETYQGTIDVVRNYYQDSNNYYVPRNLNKLRKLIPNPFKYDLTNGKPISIKWNKGYSMYPHQQEVHNKVIDKFKKDINALVMAPTRFGKTATSIGIIATLKVTTLILVDKSLLVNQFINDAKEYTDVNISKLDKSLELTDVTITTFQFLQANKPILKEIKDKFGLVVVDELHVSGANTYKFIIQSFNSRYRLGVSATPSRPDGLTNVLYDLFGSDIIKGVNPDDMEVLYEVQQLPISYTPDLTNVSKSYTAFFLNNLVVQEILHIVNSHRNKTIMLATSSVEVQNHYCQLLNDMGITTCVFNSNYANKKLQLTNLQKVNAGEIEAFCGFQVLLKGVSIPRLSVVINMMTIGSKENLEQLVGRLKTKFTNKSLPLFITLEPKWGNYKSSKVLEWLEELPNVSSVH